jgi:hypothetical protein
MSGVWPRQSSFPCVSGAASLAGFLNAVGSAQGMSTFLPASACYDVSHCKYSRIIRGKMRTRKAGTNRPIAASRATGNARSASSEAE